MPLDENGASSSKMFRMLLSHREIFEVKSSNGNSLYSKFIKDFLYTENKLERLENPPIGTKEAWEQAQKDWSMKEDKELIKKWQT